MGIMHREIISTRRDTTIIYGIVFLSLMIALANVIGNIKFSHFKLELITDPIFIFITIYFIYFNMKKCSTSFKYSVIGNQLIIHRIKQSEQETLENIKLDEIVFLGNTKDYNHIYKVEKERNYTCKVINDKRCYCCIYKKDNEYNKFYFEPSRKLIDKLKKAI